MLPYQHDTSRMYLCCDMFCTPVRCQPSFRIVNEFQTGDIISFGPNSGRIFRRWPDMEERLEPINHKSPGLKYKSYLGEDLFTQTWEKEDSYGKKFNGNRGQIHEIVFNYAKELGIDIRLGQSISDYFETDTEAGVISNGERIVGDVVLAADGVRSKGRKIILSYEDKPKSSGYAIYRAWFDSDQLAQNPLTADLVNNGDTHNAWLGPDIHFLSAAVKDGKEFSWVCTHKVRALLPRHAMPVYINRV
jgi:2-polyprenyl-6-methoxyphenol hydroxylase-like FAD-dependent oxidoreductase